MATDVNPAAAFYGWGHEELPERDDSQEVSVSKMLDHGSISFGRFAYESLEWERRSVFSHNRCQEELEKFKSPGLVAQKKAYFEEYYKKIRALKAMQENQQTELSLDYGGDGSISSQTGEDETAVQIESLGGVASIDAYSKEASDEKKQKNEVNKIRHVDFEPASSILDSSTEVLMGINQEKSNICALQMEHLDSGSTVLESLIRAEEIELLDHNGFDDKGISKKHDNSKSIVMQEENSSGSDVNIQHIESMDRQLTDHESLIRTEVIDGLDDKEITRKKGNLESNIGPVIATGGSVLHLANPNAVKSDCNNVQEKAKSTVRKYKDHMPIAKAKGPAASVRNGLKSEPKVHADTKPSHVPKYPIQKVTNKTKNSVGSSNKISDRVSRNHRSIPVTSHKPLTEVRSNATTPHPPVTSHKPLIEVRYSSTTPCPPVTSHKPVTEVRSNATTPRPFAFASERRSAVPAGSRDGAPRLHSKNPNRLATSLNQATDVRNMQDTSTKTARTHGVKCKGSENKRSSEEVRDRALLTSRMGKGVNTPEPPKARISRSVNLPARKHTNPHGGSEHRSTNALRKDKQKEVESSHTNPLPHKGRMPLSGGLSHNGAKPRQEMPQWR